MLQEIKLKEAIREVKHLPGEHNQLDHGHPGPEHNDAKVKRYDSEETWKALDVTHIPSDQELKDAFHIHGIDNLKIAVTNRTLSGSVGIRIQGDGDGANFERMIYRNNKDELVVHHQSFVIDKNKQSKGIGSDMIQHAEDLYKKMGVDKITLTADSEVGKYAWARMGYDFSDMGQQIGFVDAFYSHLDDLGIPKKAWPKSIQHSWDIASYEFAGNKIGKNFLLNPPGIFLEEYDAEKSLDLNDEGYKVGQLYYSLKHGS